MDTNNLAQFNLMMLCEAAVTVASEDHNQKIISEPTEEVEAVVDAVDEPTQINPLRTDRKMVSLLTASKMSANVLLKNFTVCKSEELKRRFSYHCKMRTCEVVMESFRSELKSKLAIQKHLHEHINQLQSRYNTEESQQNFMLATVEKMRHSRQDAMNRRKSRLVDLKALSSNEKENLMTVGKQPTAVKNPTQLHKNMLHPKNHMEETDVSALRLNQYVNDIHLERENGFQMKLEALDLNENTKMHNQLGTQRVQNTVNKDQGRSPPKATIQKRHGLENSDETRERAKILLQALMEKKPVGDHRLICEICVPSRRFTAASTLVSHLKSHAGIRSFECPECHDLFTRRHSLNYHLMMHAGFTRFTCQVCGKKFRHPSHFQEHSRRHTGEAPFSCTVCDQRFKTRNTYKRHMLRNHNIKLTHGGAAGPVSVKEEPTSDDQEMQTEQPEPTAPEPTAPELPSDPLPDRVGCFYVKYVPIPPPAIPLAPHVPVPPKVFFMKKTHGSDTSRMLTVHVKTLPPKPVATRMIVLSTTPFEKEDTITVEAAQE